MAHYKYEKDMKFFVVCGSKDSKISVWNFDISNTKQPISNSPKHIIYGHYNEIVNLTVDSIIGIIVSADKVH